MGKHFNTSRREFIQQIKSPDTSCKLFAPLILPTTLMPLLKGVYSQERRKPAFAKRKPFCEIHKIFGTSPFPSFSSRLK